MMMEPQKILLTGSPGCGKTTAIIKIIANLKSKRIAGFYTQEIRENNTRKGFSWNLLNGATGILAHVNIKGHFKVGKYGIDVIGFDKSVVPVLDVKYNNAELFIIDEIGKMECLSEDFVVIVRRLFASEKSILATVAQKGTGLISEVKSYPNVKLLTLARKKCDKTVVDVMKILLT